MQIKMEAEEAFDDSNLEQAPDYLEMLEAKLETMESEEGGWNTESSLKKERKGRSQKLPKRRVRKEKAIKADPDGGGGDEDKKVGWGSKKVREYRPEYASILDEDTFNAMKRGQAALKCPRCGSTLNTFYGLVRHFQQNNCSEDDHLPGGITFYRTILHIFVISSIV